MFISNLKFSLHHLKVNIGRTIYAIFISFLLSFLSLFLLIIDISMKYNGDHLAEDRYMYGDTIGAGVQILSIGQEVSYLNKGKAKLLIDYINDNDKYIYDAYYAFSFKNKASLTAVNINKYGDKLKNKNLPTSDSFTYISEKYSTLTNKNIGDTIESVYVINDIEYKYNFVIRDIIVDSSFEIIQDISVIDNKDIYFDNMEMFSANIGITTKNDFNDTLKFNRELVAYLKNLNGGINKTFCDKLSEYEKTIMTTNIFFYVTLLLTIVVVLLSISIISNSSIIMLDLNKKNYGLLKVLGLKNKDSIMIMIFEILITLIFGMILGIIAIYSFMPVIKIIFNNMWQVIYSFIDISYLLEYNITITNGFYIPIIFIIIVVIFMILVSINNIKKILSRDSLMVIKNID